MAEDHHTKFGAQELASTLSVGERKVTADRTQDSSVTESHLEIILSFFGHLGGLNAEIDFEPSFKAVHGRVFENRFLLGVNRRGRGNGRDERIGSICEKIGMPHKLLENFKRSLLDANHVYFGVEKDEQALIFKAYLEYRDKIVDEIAGAHVTGRSFALFTGFKWDTSSPARQAVTHYAWYPSLPIPGMLERLGMTIDRGRHSVLFDSVGEITSRASEKIAYGDIQYLEVSEEGNPRRSFDINIYKSGLRLDDLYPYWASVLRHYTIPSDRIESLYQRIKSERFGHLAGGVDRQNKDFMTIYYGANRIHSSQLGSARFVPANQPYGS